MDTDEHPPIVLYIMRTLVDHFRKTVHHRRWIQRLGIILALLLIVLAFLARVQQPDLISPSTHYHAYRK